MIILLRNLPAIINFNASLLWNFYNPNEPTADMQMTTNYNHKLKS